MSNGNQHHPYKMLGNQLRRLREKNLESLAEVSGAVEIDTTALLEYENGVKRPSEDILLLLISHFSAKESEATELWNMAGYTDIDTPSLDQNDDNNLIKPIIMMLPMDNRIVYSDIINVDINKFGVVMNFMQNSGLNNQNLAIARVGMSKEHAKNVLEILSQTLHQAEQAEIPRALPAPKSKSKHKDKK